MKLKTRVIVAYLLIALISVAVTGYSVSRKSITAINGQASAFLRSINMQKEARIAIWLESASHHLAVVSRLPFFTAEQLTHFIEKNKTSGQRDRGILDEALTDYLLPLIDDGLFDEIFILSIPEGEILVSTDGRQEGKIKQDRHFYEEGQKYTFIENVYYSMSLMQPTMVISTPLRNRLNRTYGVMAGRLNLQALSAIMASESGYWDSEDSYLVNRQNFFITEPKFGDNYMLKKTVHSIGVQEALKGESGSAGYRDYRDIPVIGAYHYLKDRNLAIITEIDQREFLLPAASMQRDLLVIACIISVAALILGLIISATLLKPLAVLVESIGVIDQTLRVKIGDKGPYEIRQIYEAFSQLLDRLRDTLVSRDTLQVEVEQRAIVEQQLTEALNQLQRSNTELEQFAYVASHDLQEPLRMVSSYNQLLAERYKGQLDEKADKFIHYAVDGANRMQILIQDLLAYSRVTTRGGDFLMADSHEVLGTAIKNLEVVIRESSAVITNDDLPMVWCDPIQLGQVFQNLLSNAVKFRGQSLPAIHIGAKKEGDGEWLFSVSDNGIGIDDKYADRIFIIFQRLHTRTAYEGTGIGLALCKRIIERHGGRIWFDSVEGKGTTFFFILKDHGDDMQPKRDSNTVQEEENENG